MFIGSPDFAVCTAIRSCLHGNSHWTRSNWLLSTYVWIYSNICKLGQKLQTHQSNICILEKSCQIHWVREVIVGLWHDNRADMHRWGTWICRRQCTSSFHWHSLIPLVFENPHDSCMTLVWGPAQPMPPVLSPARMLQTCGCLSDLLGLQFCLSSGTIEPFWILEFHT